MEEYKICPDCKAKNKKTAEICRECGCPLDGIMPTTDEIEEKKKVEPKKEPGPATKGVKICEECGHENPTNLRKCEKCGEPLPSAARSGIPAQRVFEPVLVSEDGLFRFGIPLGETTIGREREMREYLAGRGFVSRIHGKLINQSGRVFYDDLKSDNGTLVNWAKVKPGEKTELKDGDRLALGHNPDKEYNDKSKIAYFVFKV